MQDYTLAKNEMFKLNLDVSEKVENILIKSWFITKKIVITWESKKGTIKVRYVNNDNLNSSNFIDITNPNDVIVSKSYIEREINFKECNKKIFTNTQIKFMAMITPNNLTIEQIAKKWLLTTRQAKLIRRSQKFLIKHDFELNNLLNKLEIIEN